VRLIALFSIATLCALAVQTTILHWLPVGTFVPDLVLILAVDLGLRHHGAASPVMAFAMGYATDAFSGTYLGLNAFLLTLVFLMAYQLSRHLLSTSSAIGAVAVFVGVMLAGFGDIVLGGVPGAMPRLSAILPGLMLQAGITTLLAPWIFAAMAGIGRVFGLRPSAARE
jgi:rod shape-determining protein MreD